MIDATRFKLCADSQYIKDSLTGYEYSSLTDICKLLNESSDELYQFQLLLMDFDYNNPDELRRVFEVLRKYGIDNAEKLDQVLFNQRVW